MGNNIKIKISVILLQNTKRRRTQQESKLFHKGLRITYLLQLSLKFIPLLLQFSNLSSQILYETQWQKGFGSGTNRSQQSRTYMCIHFMKNCANTSAPKGKVNGFPHSYQMQWK